jgi:hypothetical protein
MIIAGNRKHFYYYDLDSNKLKKIPGIQGLGLFSSTQKNQDGFSNLARLFVPQDSSNQDYFAFAAGDSGAAAVLSQKSKKLAFELKMSSSSCLSVGFGSKNRIYTVGDQAEIYVWDARHTAKCIAKIGDEGSFNTTHLAVSADGS